MQSPFKNTGTVYQIMHMEKTVAEISDTGKARIISEQFMPYDLYLDEEEPESCDIDIKQHWSSSGCNGQDDAEGSRSRSCQKDRTEADKRSGYEYIRQYEKRGGNVQQKAG